MLSSSPRQSHQPADSHKAQRCHEHGIRFFDHYSATLIHRPRSWDDEWALYREGRNRMTFHPSAEMAEALTWKSSRLNDWRMRRIQDGDVTYADVYHAEIFCMNNPEYRKATADYLLKLQAETGIDGLVFDDGVYYSGWDSCGCPHCRALFKKRTGLDLPHWQDTSFWGNYDNPAFREWVRFRYDTTVEFLNIPKEVFGADFPLSACSCSTAGKHLDAIGQNVFYFSRAINHIELEMCGEIASRKLTMRIPDMLVHRAVAAHKQLPCFGVGYAFYPDTAFLLWAMCKLFGVSCWVSAGKGRLNITTAEMSLLPNEEDILGEPYNYEKAHPDLFRGKPDASCAVFFSSSTKINMGDSRDDYESAFANLIKASFEANLPTDVIVTLDQARNYPLLALTDAACLSAVERKSLKEYLQRGGVIIASGPLGMFDENGACAPKDFLSEFGLQARLTASPRPIDAEVFFCSFWDWIEQPRNFHPPTVEVLSDAPMQGDFYHLTLGKGQLFWTPRRLNDQQAVPVFLQKLQQLLPLTYRVEAPEGMHWQAFRQGDNVVIHFLNTSFSPAPHPQYRYLDKPIGESVRYAPPKGEIRIHGRFTKAELFSPDLEHARAANVSGEVIVAPLDGVSRFCSVRLTAAPGQK